jgi:putative ABC transport system permease protein
VLSGDVSRRRKEIGIRLALGAGTSSVTLLVLRRALVGTWDPPSFATVTLVLLAVAAAATVLPALRATRVSPLEAIRTD